jgi:hypothetical protein
VVVVCPAPAETRTNCLFEEPWWLDAVAPAAWNAATVVRGGEIAARMPYRVHRRWGLTLMTTPPLTQTLGPWIRPSTGKLVTQLSDQYELMTELIRQLPRVDLFAQTFSSAITNPLPFYWNGFEHTVNYTYRIEDLTNLDTVWSELSDSCRRAIRKARKLVIVRDDLGVDTLYQLVCKTQERQGKRPPFKRGLLERLDAACRRRDACRIFSAQDAQSNTHAAIFLVWDNRSAYYLIGGGDPQLRSSGAHSLLLWHAIEFASARSRVFDFEGSMKESIASFFRSFGARQTPLLHVRHLSRRMAAMTAAKELVEACRGRPISWLS